MLAALGLFLLPACESGQTLSQAVGYSNGDRWTLYPGYEFAHPGVRGNLDIKPAPGYSWAGNTAARDFRLISPTGQLIDYTRRTPSYSSPSYIPNYSTPTYTSPAATGGSDIASQYQGVYQQTHDHFNTTLSGTWSVPLDIYVDSVTRQAQVPVTVNWSSKAANAFIRLTVFAQSLDPTRPADGMGLIQIGANDPVSGTKTVNMTVTAGQTTRATFKLRGATLAGGSADGGETYEVTIHAR